MLDRAAILRLIPHQGRMCLLDRVESWSPGTLEAGASSHLAGDNPLRCGLCLPAIAGIEYGLQAGAVHGALLDPHGAHRGYLASLRRVRLSVERLDRPEFGRLRIVARALAREAQGLLLEFAVFAADGAPLLDGRAGIVFA